MKYHTSLLKFQFHSPSQTREIKRKIKNSNFMTVYPACGVEWNTIGYKYYHFLESAVYMMSFTRQII